MNSADDDSKTVGLLSVIIPIGAMKGKLANFYQTIESTENRLVEFIVVIDDKKDGTAEEVRNFFISRRLSVSVVILQQAFNGPGPARNAGLHAARNPWIIFCDSDDILRVEQVCEELKEVPSEDEYVIGNFSIKSRNSEKLNRSSSLVQIALNPGIWRIAIRRSKALTGVFPNLLLAEDQVYLVRLGLFNAKPRFSKQLFYTYHVSVDGQLSSRVLNKEHIINAMIEINKYSKTLSTLSRENFYVGIILSRLSATYLRMNRKHEKHLPKEIFSMNTPKALGFVLGTLLIIGSATLTSGKQ